MLADVGAVLRLEGLVVAIHGLVHQLPQTAGGVPLQQLVPALAPEQLDDVPAGAPEIALQLLHDLAIAADRPVQPLQVAVDDEDQVVQLLARGQIDGAAAFGLVHLAVAEKAPDLAVGHVDQAPVVHVFHEPRLVDRHQRPEAHRDGRELPVVRHQPGMRIGRKPAPAHLGAEVQQLLLGNPAFHEGPRVDAGDHMALEEHQVAPVNLRLRAPEVVEAHVIHHRRRGVGGDVPAVFAGFLVASHDGCHGVPAVDGADAPFHLQIAGELVLVVHGDRVLIGRRSREWQVGAGRAGLLHRLVQQEMRAVRAVALDHVGDRVLPFLRFDGVDVRSLIFHHVSLG